MSLTDHVVLITGGGTGIGRAVAEAMLAEGASVVITGRRQAVLDEALSDLIAQDADRENRIAATALDVTDRAAMQAAVEFTRQRFGPITILVAAAGVNIKNRSMAAMSPTEFDDVMAINATGVYNAFQAVLPEMRSRRSGLIVAISSVAGLRAADLGGIAYCASKFAATALATAVGNEVRGEGVRVTAIYPGEVDTPILAQRPNPVTEEHRATMLKPDDVAAMVRAVALLPPHAHVPELVIKPVTQAFV